MSPRNTSDNLEKSYLLHTGIRNPNIPSCNWMTTPNTVSRVHAPSACYNFITHTRGLVPCSVAFRFTCYFQQTTLKRLTAISYYYWREHSHSEDCGMVTMPHVFPGESERNYNGVKPHDAEVWPSNRTGRRERTWEKQTGGCDWEGSEFRIY